VVEIELLEGEEERDLAPNRRPMLMLLATLVRDLDLERVLAL
jgi:hypothetical protein